MLVLSRKVGECITIGPDITIMVTDIRGEKVRIGVEAPREVPVNRLEVEESLREAGRTQIASRTPGACGEQILERMAAGENLADLRDEADFRENTPGSPVREVKS